MSVEGGPTESGPRTPGFWLNQVAWTARLERMSAIAIKYNATEAGVQIADLAERVDGINQMVLPLEDDRTMYPLPQISLDEQGVPHGSPHMG